MDEKQERTLQEIKILVSDCFSSASNLLSLLHSTAVHRKSGARIEVKSTASVFFAA